MMKDPVEVVGTTTMVPAKGRAPVAPGTPFALPADEATPLLAAGIVAEVNPGRETQNGENPTTAKIVEAIGALTEQEFGRDGKPTLKALVKRLGVEIDAKDRDAAWDANVNDWREHSWSQRQPGQPFFTVVNISMGGF